jgi:penicillin-binding protein 1A
LPRRASSAILYTYSRDLPNHEQLAQYTPPTISRIYSVEGRIIDEFAQERRIYAPIDEVPDLVKQAFISAEDKNFYTHDGFDMRGIAAAVVEAVETRGERVRGASTIPQQVVKNFLLSSDRSAERKLKELILAVRLDRTLTKDKILELYLNEIFLGQNSYGVAAAAQTYFNKTLSQLTRRGGGLSRRPAAAAREPPSGARHGGGRRRRNYVLREMHDNGYIDSRHARDRAGRAAPLGAERRLRGLPPAASAARLLHRRDPPPALPRFRRGRVPRRRHDGPRDLSTPSSRPRRRRRCARRSRITTATRATGAARASRCRARSLGSEAAWREALAAAEVPRDVDGWSPAVVLELTDTRPASGSRASPSTTTATGSRPTT